jgi:uncharacterized protein (DUF1778 family)
MVKKGHLASSPVQRDRRICVRVSPEEETILKDAAWQRRMTLAEFLRRTMLREAAKNATKKPEKP